ncbi:MAG: hypothetical protein ABIH89_07445 [Elusimicrobiota bacterium]
MMKYINKIFILAAALIMISEYGVNAAFKELGWSARSAGMGGAYTAVSDDSGGILYNPAGIVQVEDYEANFMYAKLFYGLDEVDLGLNYGAFLVPVADIGTFGVNWANFVSGDQYAEDILTIAYARRINDLVRKYFRKRLVPEMSFGINIKYLTHSYTLDKYAEDDPVFDDGNSSSGVALDMGLWSKPVPDLLPGFTAGLMFKNINQPDVGLNTKDPVPMELRVGLAYKERRLRRLENILTAIDLVYRNQEWGSNDDKLNLHFGLEAWVFDRLLGFRLGKNINELAAGFTINMPEAFNLDIRLDYAFLWPCKIEETLGTHRISFTYRF